MERQPTVDDRAAKMMTSRVLLVTFLFSAVLMGAAPQSRSDDPLYPAIPWQMPKMSDWTPQYVDLGRDALLTVAASDAAQLTCLAQAVYFEARGEPLIGQFAVAEVVLNRVDDPHYPDTICDVVFQNENLKNRCQFSFACDGHTDKPQPTNAWYVAQMVAALSANDHDRLAAGNATHYHADYAKPPWAATLQKTAALGRHIFYNDNTY
jgi:spore germination cell wall hydrolase CwlJ-like protein